jgi:hypothetical protein
MTIPPADIAFAHELRQEYRMPWKLIARLTGYEQSAIYGAVYRALARG